MTHATASPHITLVVSNPEQLLHGYTPTYRFDSAGGRIGSFASDWLLNDRQHAVQPTHCEICLLEGRFCVIDRCGETRLNGHDLALGMNATARLNEGDSLQIGIYRVIAYLQTHDSLNDDPRHLSQRSVSELLNGSGSLLDQWNDEAVPLLELHEPAASPSPEFELLSTPFGLHGERDPLLALDTATRHEQPRPTATRLFVPTPYQRSIYLNTPFDLTPTRHQAFGGTSRLTSGIILKVGILLLAFLTLGGCTMLGKVGQVIMSPSIQVGAPDDQPTQFALSLHASRTVNPNAVSPINESKASETVTHTPYAVSLNATSQLELTDKLQVLLDHLHDTAPTQSIMEPEAFTTVQMSPVEHTVLGHYDDPMISFSMPGHTAPPPMKSEQIATPIAFKILQLKDDSLLLNASQQALALDLKKTLGSTYIRDDDYLLKPGQFKFVNFQPIDENTRYLAVIASYHTASDTQWKQSIRLEPTGRKYALLVNLDDTRVELTGEDR